MSKQLALVLRDLLRKGLVTKYAIGGSMGAMQYIEPVKTVDLDVFVLLPSYELNAFQSILDYLTKVKKLKTVEIEKGGHVYEFILIDGIPVDFVPSTDTLQDAAVDNAVEYKFLGLPIMVMTPEYLIALMLKRNEFKDQLRYRMMAKQHGYDEDILLGIIDGHDPGLRAIYEEWKHELER